MADLFSGKRALEENVIVLKEQLPPGIHTNLKLIEIKNEKDNYIDFIFANESGDFQKKRVWYPDDTKVYTRDDESFEEAVERDTKDKIDHLTDIHFVYLGQEQTEALKADDFDGYVTQIVENISKVKDSLRVNAKLTYTKDGKYSEFSRYPASFTKDKDDPSKLVRIGGYLEVYREGFEPTLKYSNWEMKNRMSPNPTLSSDSTVLDEDTPDIGDVL